MGRIGCRGSSGCSWALRLARGLWDTKLATVPMQTQMARGVELLHVGALSRLRSLNEAASCLGKLGIDEIVGGGLRVSMCFARQLGRRPLRNFFAGTDCLEAARQALAVHLKMASIPIKCLANRSRFRGGISVVIWAWLSSALRKARKHLFAEFTMRSPIKH